MKRQIEIVSIRTELHSGGIVRLDRAGPCVDCNHSSDASGERCPRCGSPSLMSLARVLDRVETRG